MRFYGNRRKQWSGYVVLLVTVALAALTRNRPRYRTMAAEKQDGRRGSAYTPRRVPPPVDRYRWRRRALLFLLPLFILLPALICGLALLSQRNNRTDAGSTDVGQATIQAHTQRATDNSITVDRVVAPEAGWVALYRAGADGQTDFNALVGKAPVGVGEASAVQVPLEQPVDANEQLAAVLHTDTGTAGTFDYPTGADAPVAVNGSPVATTFAVQNAVAAAGGTNARASAAASPQQTTTTGTRAQQPMATASAPAAQAPVAAATTDTAIASDRATVAEVITTAAATSGTATETASAIDDVGSAQTAIGAATTPAVSAGVVAGATATITTSGPVPATGAQTTETEIIEATIEMTTAGTDQLSPVTTEAATTEPTTNAKVPVGTTAAATTETAAIETTKTAITHGTFATPETAAVQTAAATEPSSSQTAAAVQPAPLSVANVAAGAASIAVAQQPLANNMLRLDTVVAPDNGWVVVYRRNADGTPNFNERLGVTPVQQGDNRDVEIPLDQPVTQNEELVAVLHTDRGTAGTFEYPNGPDAPIAINNQIVAADLTFENGAPLTGSATPSVSTQAPSAAAVTTTAVGTTPGAAGTTTSAATVAPTAEPTTMPTVGATSTATTAPTADSTATAQSTSTPMPQPTPMSVATAQPSSTATVEPTATSTAVQEPTVIVASGGSSVEKPGIAVSNQEISSSTITLDRVAAAHDGWVVLHRVGADGRAIADQVVGVAPVKAGVNRNVTVQITSALNAGDMIAPLLHVDAGTIGTYEYPNGPDAPIAEVYDLVVLTAKVGTPGRLPNTGAVLSWWTLTLAALVLLASGVVARHQRTI